MEFNPLDKPHYTGENFYFNSRRQRHTKPWSVTYIIIAICVGVYVVNFLFPATTSRLLFAPVLAIDEPYRFITAAFTHSGIWHILFNMYALWLIGSALEPVFGKWRFTCIYMLSALGGNVAVMLLASPSTTEWITATVGASGAVFGLFAVYFVLLRRFKGDVTAIVIVIALNLVMSFTSPLISWQAHVGGLLAGGITAAGMLVKREATPMKYYRARDIAWFAICLIAMAALVLYKAAHVPVVLGGLA